MALTSAYTAYLKQDYNLCINQKALSDRIHTIFIDSFIGTCRIVNAVIYISLKLIVCTVTILNRRSCGLYGRDEHCFALYERLSMGDMAGYSH